MSRRAARLVGSLSVLLALLLLQPAMTTTATWSDNALVESGESRARTLLPAVLNCGEVGSSAVISWSPVTSPAGLVYSAVVNGQARTVVANSQLTVSSSFLGTVIGRNYDVEIIGKLPGTKWTTTSVRRVQLGLLGLYVLCA